MGFDFWQSEQNILFGGSNLSHLYFLASSDESLTLATLISVHLIDHSLHHLPWTFLQFLLSVVAEKMLKALFVFTSLCIDAHQERGSQLSMWI